MKATDSPAAISRTENGAFLSFTIMQFLFDGKFKSDSAPLPQRATDRGCRSYLRLVYRGCDTAEVRKCVNVLSPITLWRRSGALKQAYPERSGSNTSALVPNVAHFKQTSRRSPGTPGLQERGTIWGWGILIVPMGNMIEIAFRELIQINGRALFLIVGCAMLMPRARRGLDHRHEDLPARPERYALAVRADA